MSSFCEIRSHLNGQIDQVSAQQTGVGEEEGAAECMDVDTDSEARFAAGGMFVLSVRHD